MIRLEEITNQNVWKVCALRPFDSQKDFVAENVQSLAEACATRNQGRNALPPAVYGEDVLIGFVMVGKGTVGNGEESALIRDNYCLWRLMIDRNFQGRGYGRQTVEAVLALVRTCPFGPAEKIWLSYEPENTRARDLYRRCGFAENGELCEDEIIAVYDLRKGGK